MKIKGQLNLNQISECSDKLQEILETYGMDVFCEAVTELFNYHPLTKPATYSYLEGRHESYKVDSISFIALIPVK